MFVYTNNGYINLAHVTYIRTPNVGKTKLYGHDDVLLGETLIPAYTIAEMGTSVVAAAPGEFAYNVTIFENDAEVTKKSIVAWRIYDGNTDPSPVFSDGISDNNVILLPMPDGRIYGGDGWYSNIEEAVADILGVHKKCP